MDRTVDRRDILSFEIEFFESRITVYREMIARSEEWLEEVRNELASLESGHSGNGLCGQS